MKLLVKMLALVVAVQVLVVPMPKVGAVELEEIQIEDYLGFEQGDWWYYEVVNENLIERTAFPYLSTSYAAECETTEQDECYATEDDGDLDEFYIEDNVAYYTAIDGTATSKTYTQFNLSGYTETIETEDYELFSLTGMNEGAEITCEYSIDESYEFLDQEQSAILEVCTITSESEEGTFEMEMNAYYLEGVGMSEASSHLYFNDIPVYDVEWLLVRSSRIQTLPFSDVDSKHSNFAAIDYLFQEDVFVGYDDGTFRPDNTVNRAELLKILVEGGGITPSSSEYKNCFTDVAEDWFAPYVCYAKAEGWVEGYEDGSFMPGEAVNKVEALKMLLLSQGIDVSTSEEDLEEFSDVNSDDWFYGYVTTAIELGLLEEEDGDFNPAEGRTRESIAENLYRLLISLNVEVASSIYAEVSCLAAAGTLASDELNAATLEILDEHNVESLTFDYYMERIKDLPILEVLKELLVTDIDEACSKQFSNIDLDIEDYVEEIL